MKCEECGLIAQEMCIDCEENLCCECNAKVHRGGRRKYHEVRKLCEECSGVSNVFCRNCKLHVCIKCKVSHIGHQLDFCKKTLVYWDAAVKSASCYFKALQSFSGVSAHVVRVYGKDESVQRMCLKGEVLEKEVKFVDAIECDFKADLRFGMTDCIIVANLSQKMILRLTSDAQNCKICQINPETAEFVYLGTESLLEYINDCFCSGNVLMNYSSLLSEFSEKFKCKESDVKANLEALVNDGKVIKSVKEFKENRLIQVSLNVINVDAMVCLGILRSLKADEIFPSEKAVQSRIREAFGIKISNSEWSNLLQTLQKTQKPASFSFFASDLEELQFQFKQIPYEDEKTYAIYPRGEQWASSDQSGDMNSIKKTPEWQEMINFLRNYFTCGNKLTNLTGGKYGCAVLLKNFSTPALRSLSLGKLSFMVQMVINDDILRYQKTILIWTASHAISLPDALIEERIACIKEEIIKLLKNKPQGIPLAQIPILLKRKLRFALKLNELGFKKLKELLQIMPEITLNPSNSKNPSACLNWIKGNVAEMQRAINEIVENNAYSIAESRLARDLFAKFGKINWSRYKTRNLIAFVEDNCKGIQVMRVGSECIFMGRETEKEELSISTHNSEYMVVADNEEKCIGYNLLDFAPFDN